MKKVIITNIQFLLEHYVDSSRIYNFHYNIGEIYYVIPYRHNPENYYEVPFDLLSDEKKLKCPFVCKDKIFWIFKSSVDVIENEFIDQLPEKLFEI